MNPADTLHNNRFYEMLLQEHGPDKSEAVGWNAEHQAMRFNLLMSSARFPEGFRVLDYGCGKGDLLDWIEEHKVPCVYIGIDVCEPLLDAARARHSMGMFYNWDIEDPQPIERVDNYDLVVMSGIFNLKLSNNWSMMKRILTNGFVMAKKVLAFNCLSRWPHPGQDPHWQIASQYYVDPCKVLKFCREELSSRISIQFGYPANDVAVCVYKT